MPRSTAMAQPGRPASEELEENSKVAEIADPIVEPREDGREPFFVLFLGNSHTSNHDVPGLVQQLLKTHFQDRNVQCHAIHAPFLEDLSKMKAVRETLLKRKWQVVVLQGQKISMSGRYEYSTEGAQALSDIAQEVGTRAFWFSEWSREGVEDENERTVKIYNALAAKNGDRVIRVGDAWKIALAKTPRLELYDVDGNHENERGAVLTSLMIASQIAEVDPTMLDSIEVAGVSDQEHRLLRAAAQQAWHESTKNRQ